MREFSYLGELLVYIEHTTSLKLCLSGSCKMQVSFIIFSLNVYWINAHLHKPFLQEIYVKNTFFYFMGTKILFEWDDTITDCCLNLLYQLYVYMRHKLSYGVVIYQNNV